MESVSPWIWVGFNAFVLAMLALDLGVFHRKAHVVSFKEASVWSAVWISLALVFNGGVWHFMGQQKGVEFLTGYLIEKSLSVDNIFVIALVFSYFTVPAQYQHRVLFWGILGALVMRAAFIAAGAALITNFHWVVYLFGAFLVVTGIKMALAPDKGLEPERNPVVRLVRRLMPVTDRYHGQSFFVRQGGVLAATPLFLVLVLVEATDLVFAVDSIPAIFAITTDPFIVYTSNVFAILGLRSLYFLLGGVMDKFQYLKLGLAGVLVFVGAKMTLVDVYKVPAFASLAVIASILTVAIVASLVRARERPAAAAPEVK
jgi:tellurite resistance protein TerC